jgi:hypothetical protein
MELTHYVYQRIMDRGAPGARPLKLEKIRFFGVIFHTKYPESRSGKLHSIQHYVIKSVIDLWQFSGFLRALLRFPSPIKLTVIVESGV